MSNPARPLRSRAWVEVDLQALTDNYRTLRHRVGPDTAIIPMVKAGCYGLRTAGVLRALEAESPWGYGVAAVAEGLELRAGAWGAPPITRPILLVTPMPADQETEAAAAGLTPGVSDLAGLDRWAAAAVRLARRLDFHVEVDTGMGRAGFDWREVKSWGEAIRGRTGEWLRWTGVYTHFQAADAAGSAATALQWRRFMDTLSELPVSREDLLVHAANSAAALRWPAWAADAVRPGIFLYGGHPALAARKDRTPVPRPVVSLRARLVLVRQVPPGTSVGYGATYSARSWERWGTLSIGYGDGWPRVLSHRAQVLVRGRRVPVLGRISMDLMVVDLSGVPEAANGDVATLIGKDGDEEITVDQVAEQAGTISYEILTGLGVRLPRIEVGWESAGPE
jgi:alanine racemase